MVALPQEEEADSEAEAEQADLAVEQAPLVPSLRRCGLASICRHLERLTCPTN